MCQITISSMHTCYPGKIWWDHDTRRAFHLLQTHVCWDASSVFGTITMLPLSLSQVEPGLAWTAMISFKQWRLKPLFNQSRFWLWISLGNLHRWMRRQAGTRRWWMLWMHCLQLMSTCITFCNLALPFDLQSFILKSFYWFAQSASVKWPWKFLLLSFPSSLHSIMQYGSSV